MHEPDRQRMQSTLLAVWGVRTRNRRFQRLERFQMFQRFRRFRGLDEQIRDVVFGWQFKPPCGEVARSV